MRLDYLCTNQKNKKDLTRSDQHHKIHQRAAQFLLLRLTMNKAFNSCANKPCELASRWLALELASETNLLCAKSLHAASQESSCGLPIPFASSDLACFRLSNLRHRLCEISRRQRKHGAHPMRISADCSKPVFSPSLPLFRPLLRLTSSALKTSSLQPHQRLLCQRSLAGFRPMVFFDSESLNTSNSNYESS